MQLSSGILEDHRKKIHYPYKPIKILIGADTLTKRNWIAMEMV
jgi:hypothetical protein